MGERFAIIRAAELAAFKQLSGNACKALVALKFGHGDEAKIAFGVRDLDAFGMKKSAAANALRELANAGLIVIEAESNFGSKRQKRVWRVAHVRTEKDSLQSVTTDTVKQNSPPRRTMGRSAVHHGGHRKRLQSVSADTSKETSSTSSQKSKEEEVSVNIEAEAERQASLQAQKESARRIERAAVAVAMADIAFIQTAGGPKPADLLARSYERGNLTPLQLRARLAASDGVSGVEEDRGPMVFSVAVGGAR